MLVAVLLSLGGCTTTPTEPSVNHAPATATAQERRPAPQVEPTPTALTPPDATASHRVTALTITILSTTEPGPGEGEWGFAALVEADGQRILFDSGAKRQTVLRNAETLGIDLHTVPAVVLSHHHGDHVGGLLTLRRAVAEDAPEALATVHTARGMFEPRRFGAKPREVNRMVAIRPAFQASGGTFVVHDAPGQIAPGVWVTGPIQRLHPERNWSGSRRIPGADGWVEDTLPESQALIVDTERGLVVLSGCGHAGIVNTVTHARASIRTAPIHAAVGGFHLHQATTPHLEWTAKRLLELDLQQLLGAHCTGRGIVERLATRAPSGAHALKVGDRVTLDGLQ
ncbi:MAG: MBL fold metallo-hydrolase [Deltaproteobacteria bacterium]|nr:MBL fold metallo-hydrolase [Deltaproteobacteria bacterium]